MIGGNISIVGKPNVGKSTLFNLLVQKHLAGATRKPQTTRHTIDGVLEEGSIKYQFIDTPGLNFNIKKNFNRVLNKNALSAIYQSNLILHLVKYNQMNKDDIKVLENIKNLELPKILVLNKIDLIRDKKILVNVLSKIPSEISDYYDEIIPVSSKSSKNIDKLKKIIKKSLSKSKKNQIQSIFNKKPTEFFTAEYIREACIRYLSEEIPYSLHVEINKYEESSKLISIAATIYLRKKSHLSIVVGKNGSMIVKISKAARIYSEKLLNKKVFLKIFVKYDPKWKESEHFLNSYD
tara:strand:+ start:1399 stop:2277 length:879 start_codon:yes stop_codon:yes gene_type:complete